jgi:hypothetical protein
LYENHEVREECADPVARPLKANIITVYRNSTATAVAQLMPDELAVVKVSPLHKMRCKVGKQRKEKTVMTFVVP